MNRVLVLGSSGAGKSTFARDLGKLLGIEVIHLDSYFWQSNWVATPEEEWKTKLETLLQRKSWVMDGNYSRYLEYRLPFADTAIFIDENRYICLSRCFKRLTQNRGRNREELPPGCYEKMDWEFFQWIWNYPQNKKPNIMETLTGQSDNIKTHILRGSKEVNEFLATLKTDDIN